MKNSASLKFFLDNEFQPTHPILKRVVTTHGDIHQDNIVFEDISKTQKKANFIDLEHVCTASAVHDFAYFFNSISISTDQKKQFIKTYLEEFSDSTDDDSIESFLLDIIVFKECVGYSTNPLTKTAEKVKLLTDSEEDLQTKAIMAEYWELLNHFKGVSEKDKDLRTQVFDKGFIEAIREKSEKFREIDDEVSKHISA